MSEIKAETSGSFNSLRMHSPVPPAGLIAIVEDDGAVLSSLAFAMRAQGYAVRAFDRSLDALHSDEILDADCILLDYALPNLDGAALLHALRSRGLSCPAIFVASSPTPRCRQEVAEAGAPLIEKPLMGEDLNDLIRQMISERA